jgi:hypothetical protein
MENGEWRIHVEILTDFVSVQFCCDKWGFARKN